MSIWLSADHHFGHANILKPDYCDRPFNDVYEMDREMIKRWNDLVKPTDTVYYLGDFSFNTDRYIDELNGKIILIKGNHDDKKHWKLFDLACEGMYLKIGEFKCFLTHWPIHVGWKYQHNSPELNLLKVFDFIICGHVHEKWMVSDKNVNVGVDVWDFKPIHINNLLRFLRKTKGERNA